MATVTLWTDLRTSSGQTLSEAGAQTTGTWATVSKPSGATAASDAPGTYNGTIDYTGEPNGSYVYDYTVGASVITGTVNITATPDRVNTTCADAYYIASESPPPFTYVVEDDSREVCGVHKVSTDQELPIPGKWGYGTYGGDIWYQFKAGAKSQIYQVLITVDGSIYGSEGVYSPAIEMFTFANVGEDCDDKIQTSHQASPVSSQTVTGVTVIQANTITNVVFRISSLEGNEGRYDITIEGICP